MRKLVLPFLVLFALALFNPNLEDFQEFVEERSGEIFARELGDSDISDMLSDLGAGVTRMLSGRFTDRTNYFIFSTYTIDMDGPEADENEWKFLGIAGQFFQLKQPDDLREE